MPDFDKNLNPILPNKPTELPKLDNPATNFQGSYIPLSGGAGLFGGKGNEDPIFKKGPTTSELLPTVSAATLYANRRYGRYDVNIVDIEDQKAYAQSWWDKATNGVLKGLNLTATTVAGGFGTLYGAAKAPFTGRLADIWDNEVMQGLDRWNNEVDQTYLPNYYTNVEKNAAWYSTDNWFKANFLFDKLVKNSGFAVGAMLSGNIANAGLVRAGSLLGRVAAAGAASAEASQAFKMFTPLLRNTARAFSAAKNVEAAAILEKEISSIADVTARSSKLAEIARTTNKFADFGQTARRTAIAAYSSAGEASFEALQTANEYRNNLIEKYKEQNFGEGPTGVELDNINKLSEKVGKASFFGNLGILTITEYAQLPKLLGSSYSAEKQAANSLFGKVEDVVLKDGKYVALGAKTKFGKIYSKVTGVGRYVIDPKEGLQEGLQYTLQVGTQNYFNKAYESKDADFWTDGFLFGLFGENDKGEGVGAFNSKEGAESMLLGAFTGGLMQAKGTYKQYKATQSNTQTFIDNLNDSPTFREAFKERLAAANRGIVLQQQQQAAVLQGDKLEAKDIDADMMHNYIMPRIKYGRLDMTLEDISELKQMAFTEAGLASLKEQGLANMNDTVDSYQKRLSTFETVAKNTAEIYKSFNLRYGGDILTDEKGVPVLDSDGKQQRKYSPAAIDKMVYAASKVADYDVRIPQVNSSLITAGVDTQDVINGIIKDGKPNKEATANALNQINDLNVTDFVKDELKTALSDVIELSLRRKLFLDEHNDIKQNPLNYESAEGYGYDIDEKDKSPVNVVQKEMDNEGKLKEYEKKLEIGKEYSLEEPFVKDGSTLALAPKITVLSQTLGGEYEVKLPNGKTTFLSPEQFKKYNISDKNNTSQEVADILDGAIDTVLKDDKYKDVKKELPKLEEGQKLDKVGWVNSLDNQELVDDIEKEFSKQLTERFKERERVKKEAEQLKKNKEDITKQQGEIVLDSGSVGTNNPAKDTITPEGKIPPASILFISGTSESEAEGYYIDDNGEVLDPKQAAIHIRNQREFLNNVGGMANRKNMRTILVTPALAKAYGLEGLIEMSYGKPLSEITDLNDVDNGFIAQVFVEQVGDKLFFVDKEGKQIGEVGKQVENVSDVIFQTMRTTKLTYVNGTPRYRKDQKEEAEAYAAAWKKQRADIFNIDPSVPPTPFAFQVSRGIAKMGETDNHLAGVIIDEKKEAQILATDETLIQIPTAGVVAHQSGQINVSNGRPVIVHNDNVEFLNNRRFTKKQAQGIYEAIKQIATEINEQSKAGKRIIINKKLSRFLQNVLYWRLGKTEAESNQINISEDGSSISLSGNTYSIPEITERKDEIIEDLEKAFHNVNNKTLSAENFSKPFTEYYMKDGVLVSNEWTNYQTYLLSSKYPDGSPRSVEDTPLSTKIVKPTPAVPTTHEQKYSTLIGLELPVGVISKPAAPAAAPKAPTQRKYDYDGTTENVFTTSFGDVIFTVGEDLNPQFDEKDDTFKATRTKVIKKLNDLRLKAGQPVASEEELIPQANGAIIALVKKELEKDVAAPTEVATVPTAPIITPTAPTASVSEVEAKKADIERRRQEELDNVGAKQKKAGFLKLREAKTSEEQLNAINEIERNVLEGAALTKEEQKEIQKIKDNLSANGYEVPELLGKQFHQGMKVIVTSSIPDNTDTLAEGEEIITKVLKPQINKDDKMVQTAQIEVTVGTKKGGLTKEQWLEEQNKKEKRTDKINAVYDAELAALEETGSVKQAVEKPFPLAQLNVGITRGGDYFEGVNNWKTLGDGNFLNEFEKRLIEGKEEAHVILQNMGFRARFLDFKEAGKEYEDLSKEWAEYKGKKLYSGSYILYAAFEEWGRLRREGKINIGLDEWLQDTTKTGLEGNKPTITKEQLEEQKKEELEKAQEKWRANVDERGFPKESWQPIEKEINDRYTLKLKEIEKSSIETPKEPGSFNPDNIADREDMGFRKVSGLDKTDRMTESDYKAFKEWHAKNVPFIPFEVLENIINTVGGEKAWGVFENGVAKFVRGGLRGTEYHEIGEAIWNGMLSKDEQQALINEFRKKAGKFTDRETGKKYNYDDVSVTDNMVKERILDDFADYRLGKLPARTLGEAVRKFFKMIMDFFKSFVTKPSLKEDLFKAIDTGKFADRQLSTEAKSLPPQYRGAGHLTEEQTNAYVKDMTAIASAIILGNGKIGTIDKSALYDLRKLTSDDIFNKIEEFYTKQKIRQELGDVAWKELVEKTKQELKTLLKVDFNEEDLVNINDAETNKNDYVKDPFSIDYKKSAPIGIKFVSATLLETEPTNQENSNSFELPKAKVNPKTQTYSLLGYTRVFNTMLDKLKNTTGIGKVVDKIVSLANQDSNYVRMFKALGGSYSSDAQGRMTKTINFKDFKFEDWRLFIEMMQTYTKQKPDAVVQYISQGQVYSGSAMVTGIVNVTTRGWVQNMRNLAKEPDSYVTYNSGTKTYSVTDLSGIPTNTPEEKIEFLSKLGIIFPIEAWKKLKEPQQKEFTIAVASIKAYLEKAKDVMNIQKKTLNVAGQYNTLATLLVSVTHPNQETTRINLDGKQSNSFADNNAPSVFENEFNEVETLDELLKIRPELNDVYSKGSQLLKKGGQFFDKEGKRTSLQLKVGYIEGTKNKDDNKGTTSVKLTKGDRFTQELNQNLLGQYYIMIPADGSTEWMMNMGNHVAFEDVEQGNDGWKQINKIFRGYLTDDVALALDADNRKELRNIGSKVKELRFFKEILSDKVLSGINEMIAEGKTQEDIEKYIDENIDDVNVSIKEYIDNTVEETKKVLMQNGQLVFDTKGNESYYKYKNLVDTFAQNESLNKNKLTEDDVTNILTFANTNYIINNIEFHKILFGDPYQFAIKGGNLDATKRFKSFLSPRRTTFDSPEFNTFLNEEMNKAGDIELQPGEPGYHQYKSWVDTVTVNDVTVMGSITNIQSVPKEVRDAFAKTNEGDASSIIIDGTYRELKIKNRQWTPEAEAWHQWQMSYTRQNMPGFKYSEDARGKALEKHDIELLKTKEPKHTIEVIKPIVSGSKNGSNTINLVLDKFSQMPMYYSMVQGTNLEKLYTKMMQENKGYIIMISGRKVGAETLHELYTPKGEFNEEAFNNNIEVPWKAYGIQVETTYEGDKQQTRGSQLTKLSTLDLYENGEALSEDIAKEVKRNTEILDKLHKNGYERFLKRLGIEDLGGSYKIVDKRALAKALQDEMFRRELSDNVKDSVQLDENGEFPIPFEASPAYLQIKSILYSFVDKEITSPKMNGGAYVQVPVTMWEDAKKGRKIAIKTKDGYKQITRQEYDKLTPEEQKKVVLTDDTLKFYEDENGKRHCEIMLPHWFKGKLGKHAKKSDEELIKFLNSTKEGREMLSGIGFRIPTQSLSSVEAFIVKGFLPQYMGKTVIVPSEITTKAGSDFDIDKLNIYLKSIYVDKNGDVKIVKLKGTEQETKDFYANVFDEKLEKQKLNKAELLEALDIFTYELEDPKNLVERYIDNIEALMEEVQDATDASDVVMQKLEKLGDKDFQAALKQEFVNNMYRRALENEYYDSLEKLVTFPENFQRLISPVSDDGLKEISDDLDKLRGYDENKIKNRLLDRNYMTSLRHAFVTAKKWVGIAAVNITGHSLTQKFKAYIDPARFANVSIEDRKILGNGEMLLDHNTIEKDGQKYISLSGRLDAIGKFISDGLSGFATTFVDVAKDPYILKIIKSDLAVGTFMFLRRVGVPKRQLAMFMNQPIIDEYLTLLDNNSVKTLFDSRYIAKIEQKFPTRVTQKGLEGFNKNELEGNIEKYYATKDLGDYKNYEQHNILREFLKYAKMAEYSFNLTQASNYDTTKFQSGDSLSLKQWRTETAKNKNIISSVNDLLENTFIGEQAEFLDKSMDALGEALPLERPEFTSVTDEVLKPYANDRFLNKDKFDKIANKIKAAFLDYIIQKRSDVATNLQQQLVDDRESVAQMLVKAKQTYPNVQIIQDLEVDSSGRVGGAQTIKLKVNDKLAYNENMYAGMMRELRDDPNTNALYKGIVRLAILQGTYQSTISIKNIIPVEDYSAHITPIISGLRVDDELRAFAKTYEFQRNEWQDNDVVPIVEPRFSEVEDTSADPYAPRRFQAAVVQGKQFTYKGAFPNLPNLVKSKERQILFLNSKYQAKATNYDVVKVPRAVPIDKRDVTEGKVDVLTGMEITNQTYAEKLSRGDTSLRNYYGYQKVKYADGSPLIAEYDKEGNPVYVYKFINLHGDGQYAAEYYGDGRPSVFNNGTQKNVKNVEGTIVSNEIPDQTIVDYYGGETVPSSEADVITATIEKEAEKSTQPTAEVKKKELFTPEKGIAQKSFRGKSLNFVDNISSKKETVVAMSNNKQTGVISIDTNAMFQKFRDKAWTKPAKQLDGSFATPLAENEFSSMDEWFTFALIHEVKHDTILKQKGETTGQYEDRINQAALADLRANYNVPTKEVSPEVRYKDKEKRIRIDYPSTIINTIGFVEYELNSSDLVKMTQVKFDNKRIAEPDMVDQDYGEAIAKKYGESAGDYAAEVDKMSIPEAEFLRDNGEFAYQFIGSYFQDELSEGKTLQEYAQAILDQNETLVDTAQMSLFDSNNEDVEGGDNPNPCGQ